MVQQMQNKIILITGANSGIGKATATGLAERGAQIIMLCRDERKAELAKQEIQAQTGNQNISLFIADLSLQQPIHQVVEKIKARHQHIDVLIHNAGIFNTRREMTADGIEAQFALHHLAPMLLSYLLLDQLYAGAPARIISVTSMLHRFGKIDFNDLQSTQKYNGLKAYGTSKLANIMFTRYLATQLNKTQITVNCLHPGAINSNLGGTPNFIKPFMSSPQKGARTPVYLASSPEVAQITGAYFVNSKIKQPARVCDNKLLIDNLMAHSEQLIGMSLPSRLKKVV